jgi:transcriptional regulator with XRE-family HTH domain
MLRWARESSNYSIDDFARRMSQDPAVIRAWESGEAAPTYKQLERLADYCRRPVALFFFPEPPAEEGASEQFRTLPGFVYKALSPATIHLIRKARAMRENLRELCDGKRPVERNLLEDLGVIDHSPLSLVAAHVRSYLGVPLEEQAAWGNAKVAFSEWRNSIEQSGVFIFKDAFHDDSISGFCLYDQQFPIVYVNSSLSDTRQVFTLFHELAHLLSRTGGIDHVYDRHLVDLQGYDKHVEVL